MTTLIVGARWLKLTAMQDRAVAIVAILAGSVVVLGVLYLVAWLVTGGHGSEALIGLAGVVVAAYLQQIHGKVTAVDSKVAAVEKATGMASTAVEPEAVKRS